MTIQTPALTECTAYVGPTQLLAESLTDLMLMSSKPLTTMTTVLTMHAITTCGDVSLEIAVQEVRDTVARINKAEPTLPVRDNLLRALTYVLTTHIGDVVAFVEPDPESILAIID